MARDWMGVGVRKCELFNPVDGISLRARRRFETEPVRVRTDKGSCEKRPI